MYNFSLHSTSNSPGTSSILISNTAFSQRESLPCQRNQRVLPRSQPPKHPNTPRFYIDTEIKGADFKYRVIEDVETVEADEFEAKLKKENLPYLRTDF